MYIYARKYFYYPYRQISICYNLFMFTYGVIYIFLYSFIAWVLTSTIYSISLKHPCLHIFFYGPYIPTYGITISSILFISNFYGFGTFATLILCIILGPAIPLLFEFIMNKIFYTQWWRHEKRKYRNLIYITAASLLSVFFIHPILNKVITYLPENYIRFASSLIIGIFFIDFLTTFAMTFSITELLRNLKKYTEHPSIGTKYEEIQASAKVNSSAASILEILHSINNLTLHFSIRMINNTYSHKHDLTKPLLVLESYGKYKQKEETKRKQIKKDEISTGVRSFASGLNFYKLFWVFMIGSVFGFLWESLYCLVKNGYIESRQGMIYGPFSQVYGFGAIILSLALVRFIHKKGIIIFMISAAIGGLFEGLAAYTQQIFFNTTSWHYPPQYIPLFGGRTCLLYMIFWGFLGYIFVRFIYPLISEIIEKIPNKYGIFLSWILIILISADLLLSGIAVHRWQERKLDPNSKPVYYKFIDEYYDDAFMRNIYPHMKIHSK